MGALAAGAALFELDVYGDGVHCQGGVIVGDGAPILSHRFHPGEAVQLDVPPGHHAVRVLAFADSAGAQLLGSACQEDDFGPAAVVCLDLTLAPIADLASVDAAPDAVVVPDLSMSDVVMPDLAMPDLTPCLGPNCPCASDGDCTSAQYPYCTPQHVCGVCHASPDNCPRGQYCGPDGSCLAGCKTSADCVALPDGGVGDGGAVEGGVGDGGGVDGGSPSLQLCDQQRHLCVECLSSTECATNQVCSPQGLCTVGCDLSHPCPGGQTCCSNLCVDTTSDPAHCGGCGQPCSTAHGVPSCSGSTCSWSCDGGYAHCMSGNTGCETSTTTITNCGGCNNVCDTTNAFNATCTGTACAYVCKPGHADCVTTAPNTDGCETGTHDVMNCGGCAQVCDTVHSTGAACPSGVCTYTGCTGDYADCSMTAPNTDGCETSLTSIAACGACMQSCDTMNSNGAACPTGAQCTYTTCKNGFANCDKSGVDANGCETSTTTITNCGDCNNLCDTTHATNASCDGTACSYTCASGWLDCIKTPPNINGCETPSDTTNCGVCGSACSGTNATATTCTGTTCTYTCSSGYLDCNRTTAPDADGCECQGTTCCMGTTPASTGTCAAAHNNGVGQSWGTTFYDCVPAGTYSMPLASDACTAYTGNSGQCANVKCAGPGGNYAVCSNGAGTCICWDYVGTNVGHVLNTMSTTCGCPASTTTPSWQ
jgi:hypothetical protein